MNKKLAGIRCQALGTLLALTLAVSAQAIPITVVLTVPNAHGHLYPPSGPSIPFTAPSVTFQSSGDTDALFQTNNGVAFKAPILVLVPGIVSGTVTDRDAAVNVGNVGNVEDPPIGVVGLLWGLAGPLILQGGYAHDPKLRDYLFQTSFATAQVEMSGTTTYLRPTTEVLFQSDAGLPASVAAGSAVFGGPTAGILTITVGQQTPAPGTSIPTLQREGLTFLVFLLTAIGLWRLRHGRSLTARSAVRRRAG
jgi:hypothetical protein